jgi:hypothetical protein
MLELQNLYIFKKWWWIYFYIEHILVVDFQLKAAFLIIKMLELDFSSTIDIYIYLYIKNVYYYYYSFFKWFLYIQSKIVCF